jgi:serine/threonine protein kinase
MRQLDPMSQRIIASGLVSPADLEQSRSRLDPNSDDPKLLDSLVQAGRLTQWHVVQLQAGKERGYFLDHYKLLEPIGAGGMGQVFRAIDTELNRQVAIKVLPKRSATREAVERFRREGQAALRVQHEHIVRSFELGHDGDTHFLVMELVVGTNLAKYIAKKKRLPAQETARIGFEVAQALDHAREHGIIHRDIKPSNILLTRKGVVKLADLGLAKFFGSRPGEDRPASLTHTGDFMGTVDYCAPEQAEDAKHADTRSDIYSLGCTLYHCLTGQPPFPRGTSVQKIVSHREHDAQPIHDLNSDVPQSLSDLIHKRMLAKRPEERFQTPTEVANALHRWVSGEPASNDLSLLGALIEDELGAEAASRPSSKPPVTRRNAIREEPRTAPATPDPWTHPDQSSGRVRRQRIEGLVIPVGFAAIVALVLAWFFGPWRPDKEPEFTFAKNPPDRNRSDVPRGPLPVPVSATDKTQELEMTFADDFNRSDLGAAWTARVGDWSIDDGTLRATLQKQPNSTLGHAQIELTELRLPETADVRFEVTMSGDMSCETMFLRRGNRGIHDAAMLSKVHPGTRTPGTTCAAIWTLDESGRNGYAGMNPAFRFVANQRYRVHIVRERSAIRLLVDGAEATRASLASFGDASLAIGSWGSVGTVISIENLEIRVSRGSRSAAEAKSAAPSVVNAPRESSQGDTPAPAPAPPAAPLAARHTSPVIAVAFSTDRQFAVTGSMDTTARVWDLKTGDAVGEPMKHTVGVQAVAISPDSETIATSTVINASEIKDLKNLSGSIHAWDCRTGAPRGGPFKFGGYIPVGMLGFSGDGREVTFVAGIQGGFRWLNLQSQQERLVQFRFLRESVKAPPFAISPNGTTVFTGSPRDQTEFLKPTPCDRARLWDTKTGGVRGEVLEHGRPIIASVFSVDSRFVLAATDDGKLRLWDARSASLRKTMYASGKVFQASFSGDGTVAVTLAEPAAGAAGSANHLEVWDVASGTRRGDPILVPRGIVAATVPAGGGRIALIGSLGEIDWQPLP